MYSQRQKNCIPSRKISFPNNFEMSRQIWVQFSVRQKEDHILFKLQETVSKSINQSIHSYLESTFYNWVQTFDVDCTKKKSCVILHLYYKGENL